MSRPADRDLARRTGEGMVQAINLMAATYPQPEGRPIRLTVSHADTGDVIAAVDIDLESGCFLASRAGESAMRGQAHRRAARAGQ
ncbi:hypothetical protein AB0L04_00605 [Streptomyces glaucescens]|uniref:hypothetical protein n=1 Tax=Streptomyces glaucescens TaxID=1907 RepID=UPI00344DC16E